MLVRQVCSYKNSRKNFVYKVIKRIDFLSDISIKIFNEVYYGLRTRFYEKGSIIIREGEAIDCFLIVETGMLEL